MNSACATTVLVVEDNPGDRELLMELLSLSRKSDYQFLEAATLARAMERLRSDRVDVVLLDLRLPDASGVEGIRTLRQVDDSTPIVVLTGSDDEKLALACIDAGAQDYLSKAEVHTHNLRRAIGYAITRIREAQVGALEQTLDRYRAMSSANHDTSVTASLAGSGAVSLRHPDAFQATVDEYFALIEPYLDRRVTHVQTARTTMEGVVTKLGNANGGPRDLLDLHVAALDRALAQHEAPHSWSVVYEARLLALEMMGLLVDYYRVGHRRITSHGGVK